jgi:integrase
MSDRKEAMKLAIQWEDAARKRITEAQARRVLSDIHEQIHGSRLDERTLAQHAEQWLARKKGVTAAVTLNTYRLAVNEFVRAMGDKANASLHYITSDQISAWRDAAATRASARTANNKLKIVRVMFQEAWRDGILTENPASKVQVLKSVKSNRRPFTVLELKTILRIASLEWRGMILAGLYTGQRLKDIASLTWANVDIERGEIKLSTSKTSRNQVIPIAAPLSNYLAELPVCDNAYSPLFPNAHRIATGNLHVGELSRHFGELLVEAGLAKAKSASHVSTGKGRSASRERNELSFHCLRHTATSWLKNAGVSEAIARDIIGHESAEISRQYTHVDEQSKRTAIEKLPDVTS